jgi:RNA polymerase sigma-70 factor (ECF subfamily)
VGDDARVTESDRFEAFVREFQDMVYGTAVRLLGNPTEAEDVSQTVFLRAFQRFDEIGTSPTAAGWLKTVTTNLCLNHLTRYRARWQFFSELDRPDAAGEPRSYAATLAEGASTAALAAPEAGPDDTPEARMDRADRQARLEAALRRLPDHQRVSLVLFHFEDKSYQEIAELLGASLAKVKTDIYRGRAALRNVLGVPDAS